MNEDKHFGVFVIKAINSFSDQKVSLQKVIIILI